MALFRGFSSAEACGHDVSELVVVTESSVEVVVFAMHVAGLASDVLRVAATSHFAIIRVYSLVFS